MQVVLTKVTCVRIVAAIRSVKRADVEMNHFALAGEDA